MKRKDKITIKIILKLFLFLISILCIFAFVSIIDSLTIRGGLIGLILITSLCVLCGITINARDLVYIKNILERK